MWQKLEKCHKKILHKQNLRFNELKEKARELDYQKFANTTINEPIINKKKDYLNTNPYYIEALNIEEFKIEDLINSNTNLEYFAIPSDNIIYNKESNKNSKKILSNTQKQKNDKIIEEIKKAEEDRKTFEKQAKEKAQEKARLKAEQVAKFKAEKEERKRLEKEAKLKAKKEAIRKAKEESELLKSTLTKEKLEQIYELEYIKSDNNILTSISIPANYSYYENIYKITRIGNYVFSKHKDLQNIILPDSINYIGEFAFSDCTSLKTVNIPNNVKIIERGTFYNCKYLANINIPNSIIEIKEKAFSFCNSLKNITIPKSVKNIGNKAFAFCMSLKEVIIQNSKNNIFISNNAFDKDVKIIFTEDENIQYEEISNYKEIGDILFIENKKENYTPKQEEVTTNQETKQKEENISYLYPILKPLKEFSNKPIDLYSVQKAKIKAIKRGEKIENISLFDMFGKVQEKVRV